MDAIETWLPPRGANEQLRQLFAGSLLQRLGSGADENLAVEWRSQADNPQASGKLAALVGKGGPDLALQG